jgi:hypothetical protein
MYRHKTARALDQKFSQVALDQIEIEVKRRRGA